MIKNTTLKQKTILIVSGIIISLFLLEVFFRIGGAVFNARQDKTNISSFNEDEIRILCIGESTTALGLERSYPSQLEQMLNDQESEKTFKVINKGLVSKRSIDILQQLEKNIKKYKPHLVISMIGINDPVEGMLRKETAILKVDGMLMNLRVYKFFKLLFKHMGHKYSEENTDSSEKEEVEYETTPMIEDRDIISGEMEKAFAELVSSEKFLKEYNLALSKLPAGKKKEVIASRLNALKKKRAWLTIVIGRNFRLRKDYDNSLQFLIMSTSFDEDNYGAHVELGRTLKEIGEYKKAIIFLSKAKTLSTNPTVACLELVEIFKKVRSQQGIYSEYKNIVDNNYNHPWAHREAGKWFKENGHFKEAEAAFIIAMNVNPKDPNSYENLADIYKRTGEKIKAMEYKKKADDRKQRTVVYYPDTIKTYRNIIDAISGYGIKVVCMQYPLRKIEPLKSIFLEKQ